MASDPIAAGLESLAANIRRLRLKRGWTQSQLATAVGVELRYVQVMESEKANPRTNVLLALAMALEVPVASLFRPAKLTKQPVGRPRQKRTTR